MGKGCGRRTSELPGRTGELARLICTDRENIGRKERGEILALLFPRAMSQVGMLACTFDECREGQRPRCRAAGSLIYAFIVERYMETCLIPQRIRQDAQDTGLPCGKKTVLDRMDSGK